MFWEYVAETKKKNPTNWQDDFVYFLSFDSFCQVARVETKIEAQKLDLLKYLVGKFPWENRKLLNILHLLSTNIIPIY